MLHEADQSWDRPERQSLLYTAQTMRCRATHTTGRIAQGHEQRFSRRWRVLSEMAQPVDGLLSYIFRAVSFEKLYHGRDSRLRRSTGMRQGARRLTPHLLRFMA